MTYTAMTEYYECFVDYVPFEILHLIFKQLFARDLIRCRAVCSKWRLIIDRLISSEKLWRNLCHQDFPHICESAYNKSSPRLTWYLLYRSLTLWLKVRHAHDSRRYFSTTSSSRHTILDFILINDDVIGVHKRDSISYYDRNTLRERKLRTISGKYSLYVENENMLTLFNLFQLTVQWKSTLNNNPTTAVIDNVDLFTISENIVFYLTIDRLLYKCELIDGNITKTEIIRVPCFVLQLSTVNGSLHLLSLSQNTILCQNLVGNELVTVMNLNSTNSNLFVVLKRYNFIKKRHWAVYFALFNALSEIPPHRQITTINTYGHVIFAGNIMGEILIFYTSDIHCLYDLYFTEPFQIYKFIKRRDCKLLFPILWVDVVEGVDSHQMFVATPTRITVLTIVHDVIRAQGSGS